MKIAIIGGGLAGTACAYVLKSRGAVPVIYEAGSVLASGASGNDLGLYNPRFSAAYSPEAAYYSRGYGLALKTFKALCHPEALRKRAEGSHGLLKDEILQPEGFRMTSEKENPINWNPCGALHLVTDEKKHVRFTKMLESWGWPAEDMCWLSAQQASDIAGVKLQHEALYLPNAGTVSPARLCAAYAEDVELHLNTHITDPAVLETDAIILACGLGVKNFAVARDLPISGVRGQITHVHKTGESKLKTALCYGGYTAPTGQDQGNYIVGSTFQRWLDHANILPEDDADNIAKLKAVAPGLAQGMDIVKSRASIRTVSKHNFPIVKALDKNIYVSTAHGSHGIISSLAAAHILAEQILDSQ